ncbi:MAG: septum formation initiator family protein [Ignavibacterium sp.]|nr:septum formation initiator family protein [Ignavibacterium sp.]MCX7610511.1 septum formation initiator family protein [Ignavibacterium sp.]MDW8375320.1 septum formation initiator family protein [Ignavibacteriales bacterium]
MKKFIYNSKFRLFLFLIIFLLGSLYLLFNNFGLIKYMRLKKEVNSLNRQIEEIKSENKRLESEIDSLRNYEPSKIEQVAREKHNMIKSNEKKIDVIVE